MKKITLLLSLLLTSIGFSQQEVLQDFENGGLGGVFGRSAGSIVADPETGGTRGDVAMLTAASTGEIWQGINISLLKNVQLTTDKTMKIDVYSTSVITIAPKVVGGLAGAVDSTAAVSHTGTGWETLTITFNESLDNSGVANGVYNAFVIYYLWDTTANGFINPAINRVFYVDNIQGVGVNPVTFTPPTTAAATPFTRAAGDVISLYSDAYTDTAISNFDAGWCGTSTISEVMIASNAIQIYKGNACQGIEFTAIDATEFTNLHVDVYIATEVDLLGKVFNVKFVETGAGGSVLEVNFNTASTPALVKGQWISIDVTVDLSNFDILSQFGITSNLNNSVWYDNLYFWKAPTAGVDDFFANAVKLHPNPAYGVVNISTPTNAALEVSVHDLLGKLVIPVQTIQSQLNISSLNPGMYFVNMKQGTNTATKKLLVN